MLRKFRVAKRLAGFKHSPGQPDHEITDDYVVDRLVIHGGVNKVVDQLLALREEVGPFGELVYAGMDWVDPALTRRSMELMANEVMPRVNAALGISGVRQAASRSNSCIAHGASECRPSSPAPSPAARRSRTIRRCRSRPSRIAPQAIDAAKAGAAVAHIHVRDPKTGRSSMELDLYREVVERIRDSGSDVVINLTTGTGAQFQPGKEDPKVAGPGTEY